MENKVREMLSRYPLSEKERLYLKTDTVTEENQFQIKWLGENDVDEFNRHQKLCGKNTIEDDFLCDENARYCLLYADGIPAARGAIEKLSEDVWEVSDIYTAKAYRGNGFCTEVVNFICGEISANGKIITCRTRDDNESMKRVLEKTGFEVFGGKNMSIIQSHDFTLYGGNEKYKIILRPLTDEHLPYLYKWNSDKDVLYWTEGDDVEAYPPEIVHKIYGGKKEECLYFAIEVNGEIIGECWLQKMNLTYVKDMYPIGADIRRIDMSIGEKQYWDKGIGTLFVGMLVDFAFNTEKVDTLHCICEDYNIRSNRVWEKNGFSLVLKEKLPEWQKGDYQCHWRLTKEAFNAIELVDYSERFYSETIYAIAQFYGFHRQLSEENVVITAESLEMAKENIELWTGTDHELKVILFNNAFAGFVHIGYRGSNVAWIEDIYVDDKFRNKGIGTRAINLAEEIIKSKHGYTAICMDVVPRNINALNLYRSLGYDTLSMITVRKELYENNKDKTMYLLGIEFRY